MRDHGGNLDAAMARYGGHDWIDLSTGINRRPYPVPDMPDTVWTALPTQSAKSRLIDTARNAWSVASQTKALSLAGAQAAIQLVPLLRPVGRACVLTPTYNEHSACLCAHGWQVTESATLAELAGADLAVVVNPNNPDGQDWTPDQLLNLAQTVGFLVVDESFADAMPELSLLPRDLPPNVLVLRSFGKFYGLAGIRLGFAFGAASVIDRLDALSGPWPAPGPALYIGAQAIGDVAWAKQTRLLLMSDMERADHLALSAGWTVVGGTPLFRLYHTPDAIAAQEHLAQHRIWSRIFPDSRHWLRLGLPGAAAEWDRLKSALERCG